MRHCTNDTPDVYESVGQDLAVLLREAADQIDANDEGWATVTVSMGLDEPYIVTLYQH